jgi:hypothetical protein
VAHFVRWQAERGDDAEEIEASESGRRPVDFHQDARRDAGSEHHGQAGHEAWPRTVPARLQQQGDRSRLAPGSAEGEGWAGRPPAGSGIQNRAVGEVLAEGQRDTSMTLTSAARTVAVR